MKKITKISAVLLCAIIAVSAFRRMRKKLGDDEILALYLFDYAMIVFLLSALGYFVFSKIAALSNRKRGANRR